MRALEAARRFQGLAPHFQPPACRHPTGLRLFLVHRCRVGLGPIKVVLKDDHEGI
jgi:hypothetical protein